MNEKVIRTILRRWDAIALSQLAERAAQLSDELDEANNRAYDAEKCAEDWRDDFLKLCAEQYKNPGITQSGHLVAVPASEDSAA